MPQTGDTGTYQVHDLMGSILGVGLGVQAHTVGPMSHPHGVPGSGEVQGTGMVWPIGTLKWNHWVAHPEENRGCLVQVRRQGRKKARCRGVIFQPFNEEKIRGPPTGVTGRRLLRGRDEVVGHRKGLALEALEGHF